jgi:hypothetical protein
MDRPGLLQTQGGGEEDVVLLVNVLMEVAFEGEETVEEGAVGAARGGVGGETVGETPQFRQGGSGVVVFGVHHGERLIDSGETSTRGFAGVEGSDVREKNELLLFHVVVKFGGEGVEHLEHPVKAGIVVAVDPGDLAGHRMEAFEFDTEAGVMEADDVVDQRSRRHEGGARACVGNGIGGGFEPVEAGEDVAKLESARVARLPEGGAAAAAVVDAEALKEAAAGDDQIADGRLGLNGRPAGGGGGKFEVCHGSG